MKHELAIASRLALRDLRGGLQGFRVLLLSIALGVGAIASVGVLTASLRQGLDAQGRVLLGGDMAFGLAQQRSGDDARQFIARYGRIGEIATLRSMARRGDDARSVLVDVKAVDAAYPLAGSVVLQGGRRFDAGSLSGQQAVVDPLLLERLGLKVGDTFRLGLATLQIAAVLALEPDRLSGRIAFGPRVLISTQTLAATGLLRPGSLVRWQINLLLAGDDNTRDIEAVKTAVGRRFPEAGFSISDRLSPSPAMARAIDRFSQFLTLTGLASLLVGGVGVANAVAAHLGRRRQTIATFKSLGASSRLILQTYLAQIGLLAGAGVLAGLIIGMALPAGLLFLFGGWLPIELPMALVPSALWPAALYGMLVAMIFTLWPLDVARRVRAAELYRSEVAAGGTAARWPTWLAIVGLLLMGAFRLARLATKLAKSCVFTNDRYGHLSE